MGADKPQRTSGQVDRVDAMCKHTKVTEQYVPVVLSQPEK